MTSCMIAVVLGVIGVSGAREFGAKHADVSVSAAWYLLAVVPPIIIALLSWVLPDRVLCDSSGWRAAALAMIGLAFAFTEPLLYIVYDFDQRSQRHSQPQPQK